MKVSQLSSAEAAELAVKALGLDEESTDLLSTEGLCAALRRAASVLCPATPGQLVDAVLDALDPLDPTSSVDRDDLMEQLELLISAGDLLELRQPAQRHARQLFLGPPSYVVKEPGQYLLLGVRPYAAALVDDTLEADVMYEGHTRTIELDVETGPRRLQAIGLHEITREQWVRHPCAQAASDVMDELRQRLAEARPSGEIDGLTLIDPTSSVRYYRGRWREPKPSDTGSFVARRPQAYGADLWCLVRLEDGIPQALVDLPADDPTASGRDEAWRLQAALDAATGHPQVYGSRLATSAKGSTILDLFGPVPGWTERYLELVGLPVPRANGALFSYRVSDAAFGELSAFLTDMLWMQHSEARGTT